MTTPIRLAAAMVIVLQVTAARAQLQYQITDLGTLGGATAGASDVNENRRAVGWSTNPAGVRWGFFHDENGRMYHLAHWRNSTGTALGMSNNLEEACGWGINDGGHRRAIYWWFDLIAELATFGGEESVAHDVNDLAAVVGWAHTPAGRRRPVLWTNRMYDLGTLPGGHEAEAHAINNAMIIVGFSRLPSSTSRSTVRATMWHAGRTLDLGTLGGPNSLAEGINERGAVVGASDIIDRSGARTRAFLWLPAPAYGLPAGMNDLHTLPDAGSSRAWDVNNDGTVVGEVSRLSGSLPTSAFVWKPEDGMVDLNELLVNDENWHLLTAKAINSRGDIVGTGLRNGVIRAFILTPVPSGLRAGLGNKYGRRRLSPMDRTRSAGTLFLR